MLRLCCLLLFYIMLTGCASISDKVGMSQQQWQLMSKNKQLHSEKLYKELALIHIDYPGTVNENAIQVDIKGGTAMFPPYEYASPFSPVHFILLSGQCKHIPVVSSNNNMQKTQLYACYAHKTLALDPSRIDKTTVNGSLIFTYNPIWIDGFTYRNLNSFGYTRLHHSNFILQSISKDLLYRKV